METFTYASIVLSVIAAYVTARYGKKHYNKVLAGSFLVSSLVSLITIDLILSAGVLSNYIVWIIILGIAVALFLFSRILTYVFAALAFMGIVFGVLGGLVGMEPDQTVGIIVVVAGIVITILLRKHLISVVVGLLSGCYAVFILIDIVFLASPVEGLKQVTESWSPLQIASLVLLAFAVYFQYGLHEKVFGEKTAGSPASGGGV